MERNTETIRRCDRCGQEYDYNMNGFVVRFCNDCRAILGQAIRDRRSSASLGILLATPPGEVFVTPGEHLAAQGQVVNLQDELLEDYKVFRETGAWPIRKAAEGQPESTIEFKIENGWDIVRATNKTDLSISDEEWEGLRRQLYLPSRKNKKRKSEQPSERRDELATLTGMSEAGMKETLAAIDRTLDDAEAISSDRGSMGPDGAVIVGNDFDSFHSEPKPILSGESIGFGWLKKVWLQAHGIEREESTPEEISEMLIALDFKQSKEDSLVYKKKDFPYFVEFEGAHCAIYDERHSKLKQPDIGEACFTSASALAEKITHLYLRLFSEK